MLCILFCSICFLIQTPTIAQTNTDEQLAAQFYQNKEYDKAIDYYEKLYNKQSSSLFYTSYLNCLLQIGDYKKAEKIVKKNIKANPNKPDYLVDLGAVYDQSGNKEKAENTWKQAIKEIKFDEQVFSLAKSFLSIGKTDFAINTYLRGRKISQNEYPFSFELANIYASKGDKQAMVNEYLSVLAMDESYIQAVQNALQISFGNDADIQQNQILKSELLKWVVKYPDKTIFSELLIWLQIQQLDFEGAFIQAKALDKRKKENGDRIINLAQLAAQEKQFDVSKKAYQYVIDKGQQNNNYALAKTQYLDVSYQKIVTQYNFTELELTELESSYLNTIQELGNNPITAPLIKNLAHLQAFYLNKADVAINMLDAVVELPNLSQTIQAELKLELADILLVTGDIWEASLRYSQVEKSFKYDAIGQEAKFRNAKIAYYTGNFKWAQAQLDVLKGATSKLISNDAMSLSILISDALAIDTNIIPLMIFARAELLSFQNKNSWAIETLDSIVTLYPNHALIDDIIYKKAMIYMLQSNYEKASEEFKKIIANYRFDILADDAIFKLAELNEFQFKNLEKAKELYQKILEDYPGSLYVVEARKRFRKLRGDELN